MILYIERYMKHKFLLLLLFCFVLGIFGFTKSLNAQEAVWRQTDQDLETAEISQRVVLDTYLFLIRSALTSYRVGIIQAKDIQENRTNIEEICRKSRARFCINANFFDENGNPLGLVISRGVIVSKMHKGGKTLTAVFSSSRNGVSINSRNDFSYESALEAVQAGPKLLANGEPVAGLKEKSVASKRSGVCIDKSGRVIFFFASNPIRGVSFESLQSVLRHPSINCVDALNLDGGGSSQLFLETRNGVTTSIRGQEEIPVAIGLFEKLITETTAPES